MDVMLKTDGSWFVEKGVIIIRRYGLSWMFLGFYRLQADKSLHSPLPGMPVTTDEGTA